MDRLELDQASYHISPKVTAGKALRALGFLAMVVMVCIGLEAGFVTQAEANTQDPIEEERYTFSWWFGGMAINRRSLEDMGAREISSKYFDRAMQYKGTRFKAVPLKRIFEGFSKDELGGADSVLLNCFDNYQGLISIEDIQRYQLELATQIYLPHGIRPPSWLRPLMILVPDGVDAPFQERFLTANIKGMVLVKLDEYYALLDRVANEHPETAVGLKHFKDNCVYCHSLKGVGGNKGGSLLKKFDFSNESDHEQFKKRFLGFHHKDNADKQNIEQFVDEKDLTKIAGFLGKLARK